MTSVAASSKHKKALSAGSLSLFLFVLSLLWCLHQESGKGLGIYAMRLLGLGELYQQNSLSLYWFMYLFTIPAILIGWNNKEHRGAKAGYLLSLALSLVCLGLLLAAHFS